jgi:hypothetical protein
MVKIKVLAVLFVSLFLTASLAGCGGGGGGSTPTHAITLGWNPPRNADGTLFAGVAGYKLYYGPSSGTYTKSVNVGAVTTYTVSGLSAGTYYFSVTDYDFSGSESIFADEVSVTIP